MARGKPGSKFKGKSYGTKALGKINSSKKPKSGKKTVSKGLKNVSKGAKSIKNGANTFKKGFKKLFNYKFDLRTDKGVAEFTKNEENKAESFLDERMSKAVGPNQSLKAIRDTIKLIRGRQQKFLVLSRLTKDATLKKNYLKISNNLKKGADESQEFLDNSLDSLSAK